MIFVDGANLNLSAESLEFYVDYGGLKNCLEKYLEDKNYRLIRPYYYSSDDNHPSRRKFFDKLETLGYDLRLTPIAKRGVKNVQKGVDIQLAIEMLYFGFRENYAIAILCSGDQDFIPLVKTVKDMGKKVIVAAFDHSCAEKMKRIPDGYINLTKHIDKIRSGKKVCCREVGRWFTRAVTGKFTR